VDALFRDLMIGVTRFFRDREAFEALQEHAVPRLVADRPADAVLRVWVPGCSTGEEAYSIAILLQERLDALKLNFKLQVFGTDIDRRAIDQARIGVYPAGIAADVSPERLERFFTLEPGGGYRIRKRIREMLIFSPHDVIKDPPFSKLDLISCRNLLIYMEGELQKKLIPLFHYALNPGGILFLGNSETAGEFVDLFAQMDRKSKLFLRKDDGGAYHLKAGRLLPGLTDEASAARRSWKAAEGRPSFRELTEAALLAHYSPAGALIDERGDILYLHGRTGQYLEPAPGEAGMNILKMAREGLRRELTTALHKAVAHEEPARHAGLQVKTNGDFSTVDLTVQRVSASPDSAVPHSLFLVILENAPETDPERSARMAVVAPVGGAVQSGTDADARIAVLQRELRAKEDYLQTSNEELATANEELTSSNEEMQSVNEELQSTNEELETSKEELQSLNEELATVNGELQAKVADLSRVNNDMNNLMAGTGIGTIFVDHHLRIQRFNPPATQLINLIPADVGRPLAHIVSNMLGYDNLVADVRAVLDDLAPREVEVRVRGDGWYLLRIRPYRTTENVIEGAVVTFTEVTEMKKAEAALRESKALRRLAVVVRDAHDAITVQDMQGRILAWNPGAERMYGWSEAEALQMNICDLVPEGQRKDALAALRRRRTEILEPRRVQRIAKDGRIVEVSLIATALVNEAGDAYAIAMTEREVNQPGATDAR
jgi:two-component system CheB/CheR fusion protein